MLEVRFHGRGGQGAVTASKMLALASFLSGEYVISFPFFGTERRGAPVTAFTRIDTMPILLKTQVYNPDVVVVLDSKVMETVDVTAGMKPGSSLILNSPEAPEDLGLPYHVATVDATRIATDLGLGNRTNPIINTAMLGAFSKSTGLVDMTQVREAILEMSPSKAEVNVTAAEKAYSSVRMGW